MKSCFLYKGRSLCLTTRKSSNQAETQKMALGAHSGLPWVLHIAISTEVTGGTQHTVTDRPLQNKAKHTPWGETNKGQRDHCATLQFWQTLHCSFPHGTPCHPDSCQFCRISLLPQRLHMHQFFTTTLSCQLGENVPSCPQRINGDTLDVCFPPFN